MPLLDYLDPLPPPVLVFADDTDMNPIRVASWPERARTSLEPLTFDLGLLEFHRDDIGTPPIKLRTGRQAPGTTLVGGVVFHHPRTDPTWAQWHDSYGVVSELAATTLIGTRFHSLGDGVAFTGGPWRLVGCWFSNIYDDAVENDRKHSGLVDSCVLDGVHIAFSAESGALGQPGSVLRIVNSMVRLRPQWESYKPDVYNPVTNPTAPFTEWERRDPDGQHGPFFKWDKDSPRPEVHDCIFRADQRSSYNRTLHLPEGSSGSNVMLIGTEAWTPDEIASWADQIDGVTFGTAADWENALTHRAIRP
jgi:hypothetical protein